MNSIFKATLGLVLVAPLLAQPRPPANANEAQILLFNGQLPKQSVPANPRPGQKSNAAPPVSNQPTIPIEKPEDETFKEYQRMEDTNTKPCTGSQDCTLSETQGDNQINQPPVDLSDPKTAPDVGKIMDKLNSAAEAAQRNDDTPH